MAKDFCEFADIPLAPEPMSAVQRVRAALFRPVFQIAATMVLVAGAATIWMASRNPAQQTMRGAEQAIVPEVVFPKGEIPEPPPRLEWKTVDAAEHYEVEVRDSGLNAVLKQTEVRDNRLELPADIVKIFQRGVDYGWRVTTVDRDGQRFDSEYEVFRISGR